MSIIIRLQNLPWSANSVDIRRFFNGLSIPEGGVHIVGGEMGDAFIAFSTDEDARLAMAKDGGKIKDMQIKLLLSSRTEMMRVIEQARQQNMVVSQPHMVVSQPPILSALQSPSRMMSVPLEPERRRGRSPSPHRRSRDRSLGRDRRRSPDDRRGSKRDRSRSPARSSRGFSREMDRRSDRFKRDDRRYDDSRYREDRRSARDLPEEHKKYPDADHVNSRSQLHEGFRDIPPVFDQVQNVNQMAGMFQYGNNQQPHLGIQNFPDAFSRQQSDSTVQLSQAERVIPQKPNDLVSTGIQKHSSSDMYSHNQASFHSPPFELPIPSSKESPVPSTIQQQAQKPRRRTRFEPEAVQSGGQPNFSAPESNTNIPKVEDQRQLSTYNVGRPRDNYSESRGTWPREMAERSENESWNDKRQPLLNPPVSKNGDFLQVVPMDLDPSPSDVTLDNETYPENIPSRGSFPYAQNNVLSRNEDLRRENQNRGPSAHNENQNRGPPMHSENQNRGPIVHEDGMVRGQHIRTDNQSRGPMMHDSNLNRGGPPVHDDNQNRCMIDENLNRNPLMYNDNKNRRLPAHKDIQNAGPIYNVDQNRGPSMYNENQNRGPSIHRDTQNRGSPMHSENQIRGPPIHRDVQNRGSPLHGENQNRGPLIHNETQNTRSPARNDMPSRIPPSMTLEVQGMPPDARIDDVLNLFRGIPLPAANIRIEASEKGFERAFIRFTSSSDFEEALSRNRNFVQEGRCELVPCPAAAFDSAPRPQKLKPKPKPREEDLTVQLRGLPFSCKDDDVVKFLDGLAILDLFVEIAPDGRATGIGYVEFGSEKDFRAALAMNGKMIGHRYITVSVASKEMMAATRGEDYIPKEPNANARHSNNRPPPVKQGRPLPPPPPPMNQGRQPPSCIFMKGLPEGVTNRDIADFLGQVNVMPRAIHIMLRPDKMPSGEAYAEFATTSDMEAAVQMGGKLMAGNRVSIQPISFYEMSEILGRPAPIPPLPGPNALLRTPNDIERPRRPLIPEGPNDILFRERPLMEPPMRGGRPLLGNMERPAGRSSFGPNRMRGPWPNRPRQEVRFPPPSIDRGLKEFGSPGCVVSIKNLHFRAGLEELLDFFQDYKVTKDNIFRRYNENGQTTGEARVALSSPRDAQQVVRELNQKSIMGRPLTLSIL